MHIALPSSRASCFIMGGGGGVDAFIRKTYQRRQKIKLKE
jgi:hypothetical protein